MKKNLFNLAGISLIAGALFFTGCKKDDTTPPEVTLNGAASMTISLNGTFTDPGATATDDEDGDLTSQITVTGTVDVNKTGTYTLTYSVSDAAGNEGSATRTVTVKNDAETWAGTYSVNDVCTSGTYPYTQVITVSTTVNNRIHFNKFANFANNTNIYATVAGTNITLPSQTGVNIGSGTTSCAIGDHTFNGNGSKSGTTITLTYTDQMISPSTCAGTDNCTATFTKQ